MGKLDSLASILGKWSPAPQMTDEGAELFLHSPSPEDFAPKRTMERFEGVLLQRGLRPEGTVKDIDAVEEGVSPFVWRHATRRSPVKTPVYSVNPVRAVASQYPEELIDAAIEAARRHEIPMYGSGNIRGFQRALGLTEPHALVVAFPGRSSVRAGVGGEAFAGATKGGAGLATVAAGPGRTPADFDRTLLHELRHTLEGDGLGAIYRHPAYGDWSMRRRMHDEPTDTFYSYGSKDKEYLTRLQEEAARFGDARARYAQKTGRLISGEDEADEAARAILAGEGGLGDGFYPHERVFYRHAREESPEIRRHQNNLLQGLLAVPAIVGAAASEGGL